MTVQVNTEESQYRNYINSLAESLDKAEIEMLSNNPTVQEYKYLFHQKMHTVRRIYVAILATSLISIVVFILLTMYAQPTDTPENAETVMKLLNLVSTSLL